MPNWPALALGVYLAIDLVFLGLSLGMHGKRPMGRYNFWRHLGLTVVAWSLLYAAGAFKVFGVGS